MAQIINIVFVFLVRYALHAKS